MALCNPLHHVTRSALLAAPHPELSKAPESRIHTPQGYQTAASTCRAEVSHVCGFDSSTFPSLARAWTVRHHQGPLHDAGAIGRDLGVGPRAPTKSGRPPDPDPM